MWSLLTQVHYCQMTQNNPGLSWCAKKTTMKSALKSRITESEVQHKPLHNKSIGLIFPWSDNISCYHTSDQTDVFDSPVIQVKTCHNKIQKGDICQHDTTWNMFNGLAAHFNSNIKQTYFNKAINPHQGRMRGLGSTGFFRKCQRYSTGILKWGCVKGS